MDFQWVSAHISGLNSGAPIEYACIILHAPVITYIHDDMELPHTKGHTSNPWNKCPKRGLMTIGGQILIENHYRSFIQNCSMSFRQVDLNVLPV